MLCLSLFCRRHTKRCMIFYWHIWTSSHNMRTCKNYKAFHSERRYWLLREIYLGSLDLHNDPKIYNKHIYFCTHVIASHCWKDIFIKHNVRYSYFISLVCWLSYNQRLVYEVVPLHSWITHSLCSQVIRTSKLAEIGT